MDRNSVIGLILIAVILVVFSILNAPTEAEMKAQQQKEDSLRNVQKKEIEAKQKKADKKKTAEVDDTNSVKSVDTNLVENAELIPVIDSAKTDSIQKARINEKREKKFDIFTPSATGKKELIVLENEKIKLTLSTKGGSIVSAELKDFKTYKDYNGGNDRALMLFDSDSSEMGLSFFVNDIPLESKSLYFEPSMTEKDGNKMLVMKAKTSDPKKYIEFVYSLSNDSYVSNFDIHVIGLASEGVTESIEFNWQARLLATEKLIDTERMVSSVFYKYKDETRDYLSETASEELQLEAPTQWIAFKQSYFSVVLMSEEGINPEGSAIGVTTLSSTKYIKDYEAHLNISDGATNKLNVSYQFYFGPNDYNELVLFDNGMEKIVNIGWGIFGWVNMYLVIPIFNFLDGMNISYWLIILLLTIIVKILIMPLTYKNYKSSAKMRVLKPEIEEITKKYKDEDPMKKQQATMALYRSSGVNPMAGCIPMLIQMPVLIAVFRFFPSAIELRQQTFMWADDLSAYDSIAQLGFAIPFYGDHVSLFTLLMAVSTILITRMNSGQMDNSMPGMKFMMYFFPVMMIFFFNNMAAGLSYYYLISNLLSMLIMWGIKKYFIDEGKLRMQIEANKLKPKASKKSKWQMKLEEMQKQRADQMKKKK
jgi:YidC/Oxa1 family membrane protein insertase